MITQELISRNAVTPKLPSSLDTHSIQPLQLANSTRKTNLANPNFPSYFFGAFIINLWQMCYSFKAPVQSVLLRSGLPLLRLVFRLNWYVQCEYVYGEFSEIPDPGLKSIAMIKKMMYSQSARWRQYKNSALTFMSIACRMKVSAKNNWHEGVLETIEGFQEGDMC